MGDVHVGDRLYDEMGSVCNVVAATGLMHDHCCYEVVLSDDSRVIGDAEHEWVTTTGGLQTITEAGRRRNWPSMSPPRVPPVDIRSIGAPGVAGEPDRQIAEVRPTSSVPSAASRSICPHNCIWRAKDWSTRTIAASSRG